MVDFSICFVLSFVVSHVLRCARQVAASRSGSHVLNSKVAGTTAVSLFDGEGPGPAVPVPCPPLPLTLPTSACCCTFSAVWFACRSAVLVSSIDSLSRQNPVSVRHVSPDEHAQGLQGGLREEARHQARVHVVFRQGLGGCSPGNARGQRL